MALKKRHIILATLIVALGAAVYINWQFGNSFNTTDKAMQTGNQVGQSQYVSASGSDSPTSSTQTTSTNAVNSTESQTELSDSAKKYFTQAKVNRQEARDESIKKLNAIVENKSLSQSEKDSATKSLTETSKNIELEAKVENLIMAKISGDCMVYLDNKKASVVIAKNGLMDYETLSINEIVNSQANIPFADIKIIQVK